MIERNKWMLIGLLIWYVGLSLWAAYAPADRQFWLLASVLPGLFVVILVATHRLIPLSHAFLSPHYAVSHAAYGRGALHLCPDAGRGLA